MFQSDAEAIEQNITIIDLPVEILLMICENFDIVDLNSLAKSNSYLRQMTEMTFKGSFLLSKSKNDINTKKYGVRILKKNGLIITTSPITNVSEDISLQLDTLENFGHLITNLKLNCGTNKAKCDQINAHISKYMAKSLIEFTINRGNLETLTGPFEKVEIA